MNNDQDFLDLSCEFLHCKKEYLPFNYLGLPVGANPLLASTWDPLVNLMLRRILSWKHMYISMGRRVVLLNSVFNEIPIFCEDACQGLEEVSEDPKKDYFEGERGIQDLCQLGGCFQA